MIKVGDKVRSFDFANTYRDGTQTGRDLEGERACYVEGTVFELLKPGEKSGASDYVAEGCGRIGIVVERQVFAGNEKDTRSSRVWAPENGVKDLHGGVTDGVEEITA
jgi:hypothetical protein